MNSEKRDLKTLAEVKRLIKLMGHLIGAKETDFPKFNHSGDFATPFIETRENEYNYVLMERGEVLTRKSSSDLNQLLLWVFEDVTRSIAIREMRSLCDNSKDQRRFYFAKQLELLAKLDINWAMVVRNKQEEIIKDSPFDDFSLIRADYYKKLRDDGVSTKDAWIKACEKYSLPQVNVTDFTDTV
jgi:hypothetical protein